MDHLLRHIGFKYYITLEPPEMEISCDDAVTVTVFGPSIQRRFEIAQDTAGLSEFISFIDELTSGDSLPLIMWKDIPDTADCFLSGTSIDPLNDRFEICRLEKIARLIFPSLSDYSWTSVRSYFLEDLNDKPESELNTTFLRIIQKLASFDLQILNSFSRLYSGRNESEYGLIPAIADYLKERDIASFSFSPLINHPMPVNVIGDTDIMARPQRHDNNPLHHHILSWFGPGGKLGKGLGDYELRTEQIELATEIAQSFDTSTFLLAEAGTGTGKSLAYLVPAYLFASDTRNSGETVVISTHTKNLQDQLFYKDLPLLQNLADRPFRAVLLKGRSNYLCLHRWNHILSEPTYHLSPAERDAVLPVLFWQLVTETGDISECTAINDGLSRFVRDKICSDKRYCLNQRCHFFEQCYVKKIRDHARRSHLTIINHSLLFSDINAENSILGSYQRLVIDEAHQLEKVAQQYLGIEFSLWGMKSFLSHLYERDRFETGLLIQMRAQAQKSGLTQSQRRRIDDMIDQTTDTCVQTWIQLQSWFQQVTVMLGGRQRENVFREKNHGGRKKIRYRAGQPEWSGVTSLNDVWTEPAERLLLALKNLIILLQSDFFKDLDFAGDFHMQVKTRCEELEEILFGFHVLMKADEPDFVFWYELPPGERSYDVRFYGVPLNIADRLREVLFERLRTCVFSSATLSVAGKFDYYRTRAGLNGGNDQHINEYAAGSPFDFGKQCRVIVPSYIPDPSSDRYPADVSELILKTASLFKKGTLVLFTSYQMMKQCYEILEKPMKEEGIALFMQGQDTSRTALTQRFRLDVSSVLFGTDSFWEGVDVPGEALEILVITKLPFEVPSDPLVAAKMERIEKHGGNSFNDYSLPEAVIKFRQGFGRLIRHKNDRGIVMLLDTRLIKKSYGKWFLKSLPVESVMVKSREELETSVRAFFEGS